jgi:hypothetical protein
MPTWMWGALAVALAGLAVRGAFSTTRIFFVRDIAAYWWPSHLWLRETLLLAGESPLWDPYLGFGQSAVADPARLLFFPPVLLARVLLPAVPGFNLSVALAFPVAALGAYRFFARRGSPAGAALGAIVFALSGPVLSTGNMINNAWSVALIPWALAGVDRLGNGVARRRVAALAFVFALQLLAGEPVTLAASAALAVAYAALGAELEPDAWRRRARLVGVTIVSGLGGLLLASVQVLPLLDAFSRSVRRYGTSQGSWAIHPLMLLEVLGRPLYGDPIVTWSAENPWMAALNDGRGHYLLSVYIGVGAVSLALLGAVAAPRRRWAIFWSAVFAVALLAALGPHTPFYPALQTLVPPIRSFRFPAKYIYLATFAVAALVAVGWDTLSGRAADRVPRWLATAPVAAALLAAGCAAAATLAVLTWPAAAGGALARLAASVGIADVDRAATLLAGAVAGAGPRLIAVACAAALLLWAGATARASGRIARGAFFAFIALDLFTANVDINPTMDADLLGEPPWIAYTREHPNDRVYFGGRASVSAFGRSDEDTPANAPALPGVAAQAITAGVNVMSAIFPSAWRVREGISIDLTGLWPVQYWSAMGRFSGSDAERRARYLTRTGVRYYLTPRPPLGESRLVTTLPAFGSTALYEGPAPVPRASVVAAAIVEPNVERQTERMFDAAFDPATAVLLEREAPAAAGAPGAAAEAGAEILDDDGTSLTVRARAGEGGGYLVLLDSYEPNWRVDVDGQEAPLLRANGLFRAVRLAPGEHMVRFVYRPRSVVLGGALSALTAIALIVASLWRRRAEA